MVKKKIVHQDVDEVIEKDGTVFFKAKRPLTEDEHKLLSNWIRHESKKSGVNIVLVPFSVDLEVGGESL
jgi:hypothetical protein